VLFHLITIFVVAFPAPVGGMDRSMWKDPTAQQEFASWAKFFGIVEPVFEELLYRGSVLYMTGREHVVGPFNTYVSYAGCDQPWRMFVGPQRFPARLQIQARRKDQPAEQWETLYEEQDPQHRWHASLFGQERLRSQIFRWAWPSYVGEFEAGCAFASRLAFSEDPALTQVRCRFWRTQSPSPEQVRTHTEPPGAWADVQQFNRPTQALRGKP
jgi:hypothetical protein